MSDFDKEAEREKLREKYERDQEKREIAEKMSELLLQGATMTNAHCSECGDPIFRYDGQEFCATCDKPVDRDTDEGADADAEEGGDDAGEAELPEGSETIEVTSPADDARVRFGGESDETGEGDASAGADGTHPETTADPSEARPGADTPDDSPARGRSAGEHQDGRPAPRQQTAGTRERPSGSGATVGAAGDVSGARASLVRTLTRFSEAAENCEDPGRAREHLAAAREAAEALSALRR
jgi:uncharacterized Zn finger protein (UPF0148 family)